MVEALPDGHGLRIDVSEAIGRLKDLEWAASNLLEAWRRVPVVARKGLGTVYITLNPEVAEIPAGAELIELEKRHG